MKLLITSLIGSLLSDDLLDNDPFWKIFFNKLDSDTQKIDNVVEASGKAKALTTLYLDVMKDYLSYVTELSEDDYDKLTKARGKGLVNGMKKIQEQLIRSPDSKFTLEEIGAMALISETTELEVSEFEKWEGLEKLNEDMLSRLFTLEFLGRMELFQTLLNDAIKFAPISRLQDITTRRFNADFSWAMAVSILATQENLVKEKLVKLGHTKDEIKDYLKQKGNNFSSLVDWLADEIEKKENRKLRLSFYKSSTLREMRNTIEHEGFDIKIDTDDVLDILNDIEKFEKELFLE